MARFRRKPVEVSAVLYTGTNRDEVLRCVFPGVPPDQVCLSRPGLGHPDALALPGGDMAYPGSWVMLDHCGLVHACRQAVFEENFEEVPDGSWRDQPPLL